MELIITDEMVEYVRLRIADIPSSPFYPLFTDEQIKAFIKSTGGNLRKAVVYAALSAALMLSGRNTREVTGDEQIWNDLGKNYIKVLEKLIDESSIMNLDGVIMPYVAGASWEDIIEYRLNPDFVRHPLSEISPCDGEDIGQTKLKIIGVDRYAQIFND